MHEWWRWSFEADVATTTVALVHFDGTSTSKTIEVAAHVSVVIQWTVPIDKMLSGSAEGEGWWGRQGRCLLVCSGRDGTLSSQNVWNQACPPTRNERPLLQTFLRERTQRQQQQLSSYLTPAHLRLSWASWSQSKFADELTVAALFVLFVVVIVGASISSFCTSWVTKPQVSTNSGTILDAKVAVVMPWSHCRGAYRIVI